MAEGGRERGIEGGQADRIVIQLAMQECPEFLTVTMCPTGRRSPLTNDDNGRPPPGERVPFDFPKEKFHDSEEREIQT